MTDGARPAGNGCAGSTAEVRDAGIWLSNSHGVRRIAPYTPGMTWLSPDGRFLALAAQSTQHSELEVIAVEGGATATASSAPSFRAPTWLADGRLAYIFDTGDHDEVRAYNPIVQSTTTLYTAVTRSTWFAGGTNTVAVADATNLRVVDTRTGNAQLVASVAGLKGPLAVSADDTTIAFFSGNGSTTANTISVPSKAISSHGTVSVAKPAWSPGGGFIWNVLTTDNTPEVWSTRPADAGHVLIAVDAGGTALSDGTIAFANRESDLIISDLDGRNQHQVTRGVLWTAGGGTALAFGRDTGTPRGVCILRTGSSEPQWSMTFADGRHSNGASVASQTAAVVVSVE